MTTLNISYRLAPASDIPILHSLNNELFPENYDLSFWENLCAECYVACNALENDRIVGYIAMSWGAWPREWPSDWSVEGPYIVSFGVHADYRRQGIGRALLDLVWNSPERKERPLTLHWRASNTAARRLYESYGFVEIERITQGYPTVDGWEDCVAMRKAGDRSHAWSLSHAWWSWFG